MYTAFASAHVLTFDRWRPVDATTPKASSTARRSPVTGILASRGMDQILKHLPHRSQNRRAAGAEVQRAPVRSRRRTAHGTAGPFPWHPLVDLPDRRMGVEDPPGYDPTVSGSRGWQHERLRPCIVERRSRRQCSSPSPGTMSEANVFMMHVRRINSNPPSPRSIGISRAPLPSSSTFPIRRAINTHRFPILGPCTIEGPCAVDGTCAVEGPAPLQSPVRPGVAFARDGVDPRGPDLTEGRFLSYWIGAASEISAVLHAGAVLHPGAVLHHYAPSVERPV